MIYQHCPVWEPFQHSGQINLIVFLWFLYIWSLHLITFFSRAWTIQLLDNLLFKYIKFRRACVHLSGGVWACVHCQGCVGLCSLSGGVWACTVFTCYWVGFCSLVMGVWASVHLSLGVWASVHLSLGVWASVHLSLGASVCSPLSIFCLPSHTSVCVCVRMLMVELGLLAKPPYQKKNELSDYLMGGLEMSRNALKWYVISVTRLLLVVPGQGTSP